MDEKCKTCIYFPKIGITLNAICLMCNDYDKYKEILCNSCGKNIPNGCQTKFERTPSDSCFEYVPKESD